MLMISLTIRIVAGIFENKDNKTHCSYYVGM